MKRVFLCLCILTFVLCACSAEQEAGAGSALPAGAAASVPAETAAEEDDLVNFTAYANYVPGTSEPVPFARGTESSILVAYFSRADNTAMPEDGNLDGITSASLINADGSTPGSAKEVAAWIAQDTGGDLYAIQTVHTYPFDYDMTVAVGEGQDVDGRLPALGGSLLDISQYETVFLVYPVWHFSLPAPVRSFLTEYPMPGRTIYAFATNAGSQFGDSLDVIAELEPDAKVAEGLSVRAEDASGSREEIDVKVRELLGQTDSTAGPSSETEETAMQVTIDGRTFPIRSADSDAARELTAMLEENPVTIEMADYSGFEKVGSLGRSLTASNESITTRPGDIMLYNGSNIVLFYGQNTWDYTPIGTVEDLDGWEEALGNGNITAVFSLVE
ncbi:MAG: hypothetical protein HDQ87_07560 [Clostridia bacterium]|nr:hypothetical protein [Clostridia bacterium]